MRGEEELLAQYKAQGKENPVLVANSLTIRETIARFRFLAGRLSREERLAQQRQILVERRALDKQHPNHGQYEREVGASAAVLAGLLLETGRADEGLAVVEDVLPTLEKLVHDDKPDRSQPSQLGSRNYMIRRVWVELLARKGEALARTGKGADASKAVRQAVEITEELCKQEPCYLYGLAHHLTLASTLPGKEGCVSYPDRAIKALGEYIASGFDNPDKLRHDPRLEPLRKRDDFQKLVKDLETRLPTKPENRERPCRVADPPFDDSGRTRRSATDQGQVANRSSERRQRPRRSPLEAQIMTRLSVSLNPIETNLRE